MSQAIEVSTEKIYLWPDSVDIYQPRYVDGSRKRIKGIARFSDGRLVEMESAVDDRSSAFTRDVFAQYSVGELEMFTHREACQKIRRTELEQRVREDRQAADRREALFQAKAQAFEVAEVRDTKDKDLQRRIRQARSIVEVTALTSILISAASVSKD